MPKQPRAEANRQFFAEVCFEHLHGQLVSQGEQGEDNHQRGHQKQERQVGSLPRARQHRLHRSWQWPGTDHTVHRDLQRQRHQQRQRCRQQIEGQEPQHMWPVRPRFKDETAVESQGAVFSGLSFHLMSLRQQSTRAIARDRYWT